MSVDLSSLPETTAAARDGVQFQQQPSFESMVEEAVAYADRPKPQMVDESKQAAKSPGKLDVREYFRYRMFEKDKSERKEYISDRLHWLIHDICNDSTEAARTTSKHDCTRILEAAGIPTIPIHAMLDPDDSDYRGTHVVKSDGQLRALFESVAFPLFAKPNDLLGSFGAMRLEGMQDGMVLTNAEDVPLESFLQEWIGGISYLVQPVIENHPEIAKFTSGLATIRTVNFVEAGQVRMSHAIYKFPTGGHVADNFWRKGNLLANVDTESGVVSRLVEGAGPQQKLHQTHPVTADALVGMQLPHWDLVKEVNRETAMLFEGLKYQTLDIAIGEDGPIVVEVNSGGSFDLPQVASGRGFLDEVNKKFFERHGVNFRKFKGSDVGLK